jgi:hypothetical protein
LEFVWFKVVDGWSNFWEKLSHCRKILSEIYALRQGMFPNFPQKRYVVCRYAVFDQNLQIWRAPNMVDQHQYVVQEVMPLDKYVVWQV